MKTTTLQDFHESELPDLRTFYSAHKSLRPSKFLQMVQDTYGTAASRDETLRQLVNEITLMYLDNSPHNE